VTACNGLYPLLKNIPVLNIKVPYIPQKSI